MCGPWTFGVNVQVASRKVYTHFIFPAQPTLHVHVSDHPFYSNLFCWSHEVHYNKSLLLHVHTLYMYKCTHTCTCTYVHSTSSWPLHLQIVTCTCMSFRLLLYTCIQHILVGTCTCTCIYNNLNKELVQMRMYMYIRYCCHMLHTCISFVYIHVHVRVCAFYCRQSTFCTSVGYCCTMTTWRASWVSCFSWTQSGCVASWLRSSPWQRSTPWWTDKGWAGL